MSIRVCTFNVENLNGDTLDENGDVKEPSFAKRAASLRPQLQRINADILCLQEVNGQRRADDADKFELAALTELLEGTQYENYHLAHSTKESGGISGTQNLVILSKFDITNSTEIKHQFVEERTYTPITSNPAGETIPLKFDRSILCAEVNLGTTTMHIITVHFKSKIPTKIPGQYQGKPDFQYLSAQGYAEGAFVSSMKRMGKAFEARMLIDSILDNDPDANIIICGDFNAEPGEVPIEVLVGSITDTNNPDLSHRQLFPSSNNVPEDRRFSLYHHGKGNLLDHLLFSKNLLPYYQSTEIHNEELNDESLPYRFDSKFIDSDHAPFVVSFNLPLPA